MNYFLTQHELEKYEQFSLLKQQIERKKAAEISRRLTANPTPTIKESMLGAFIEMYYPYLRTVIYALLDKGYVMDTSSGFCGKYDECQSLNGYFHIEDLVIHKLAKIGVKVQKYNSFKSLKFVPEKADLEAITEKLVSIADTLPLRPESIRPSQTATAAQFRITYVPDDVNLKKQRLFEIVMADTLEQQAKEIQKRMKKNPVPDETEYKLGVFREMIEPQVRQAVLEINRKGYSTDNSGFMDKAESQLIEGDFSLEESVLAELVSLGVTVTTNPSGYTRLQFYPEKADIQGITKKWNTIAALLPDTGKPSSPSMTKRSREFRQKY